MSRVQLLLVGLGGVLLVVLFWLLLWSPQSDELDDVRAEIEDVQRQQAIAQTRIDALRSVRDRAPEIEAMLAAGASVLPRDTALPSVLRQLQTAADESGTVLTSVSPDRPAPVEGADEELAVVSLSLQMEGGYFQVVDFLRRIEEAEITPRGIAWEELAVSVAEYPDLAVALNGRMYALLPSAPPPEEEPEGTGADDDEEDADVEIEIED